MRIDERGITLHQCSRCQAAKPPTEFHKGKSKGLSGYCKSCAFEYNQTRRLANPVESAKYQRRQRYGLTQDQINELVSAKACDLCGKAVDKMHIDHDHACCPGIRSCGKCIRGALCVRCNIGLGIFGDTVEGLRKAISYLESGYRF